MNLFYRTRCDLIRTHTIYASHEYITEKCCVKKSDGELEVDLESGIGFKTA